MVVQIVPFFGGPPGFALFKEVEEFCFYTIKILFKQINTFCFFNHHIVKGRANIRCAGIYFLPAFSKIEHMTIEQIEKFIAQNPKNLNQLVKISFKARNALNGIFIQTPDFTELKQKNFWRIVTATNVENYMKSKDLQFSRMFNGAEFTKLAKAS